MNCNYAVPFKYSHKVKKSARNVFVTKIIFCTDDWSACFSHCKEEIIQDAKTFGNTQKKYAFFLKKSILSPCGMNFYRIQKEVSNDTPSLASVTVVQGKRTDIFFVVYPSDKSMISLISGFLFSKCLTSLLFRYPSKFGRLKFNTSNLLIWVSFRGAN